MTETLKPNMPINSNLISWNLPTTRANILHAFRQKKNVDYQLDPNYKWIKISPTILYRLQSANVGFSRSFWKWAQMLDITDAKFILTDQKEIWKNTEFIIKSCIDNPIKLNDLDKKPNYRKHVEYKWKDYFFISFYHNAIDWFDQEDFIVIRFEEWKWLEAKKICRAEYASSREVNIIDDYWIPTLKIEYWNPDAPWGVYEQWEYKHEITFNVETQQTKTRNWFYRYMTGKTQRHN